MRLSVFGAGSWGCAMSHQLARRGHEVTLWARNSDTVEEIKRLYADINKKISQGKDILLPSVETAEFSSPVTRELDRYISSRSLCSRTLYCDLIGYFTGNRVTMDTVARPFSPDIIVYCKSSYLLLERDIDPDRVTVLVEKFEAQNGYYPRVILE